MNAPRNDSGKAWAWGLALVSVVALGIAIVARLGSDGGGSTSGGPGAVDHGGAEIPWVELPLHFEEERTAATAIVGGSLSRRNPLEGAQSLHVGINPVYPGGVSCRPGALRTPLTPGDRWILDVDNVEAPFPLRLILSDATGARPVSFPPVGVPLGRSTVEFDLRWVARELAGVELSSVRTFRLTHAIETLERPLELSMDNVRLAPEGPTEEWPPAPATPPEDPFPESLFIDGEFDLGLAGWRLRSLPASDWRAELVAGEAAWRGGRSLGLYRLSAGGVMLVSPSVALEPGSYVLRFAVRGTQDAEYRILVEELRDGRWARTSSDDQRADTSADGRLRFPPAEWKVVEEEITVRRADLGARPVRVSVVVSGAGDVFLDGLQLEGPAAERAGRDELVPRSSAPAALSWSGVAFSKDGAPTFPVLYRDDAMPLDDDTRVFASLCRERGLLGAVDLGGALHGRSPETVLLHVGARRGDAGVGLWLLTGDAAWPTATVPPAFVRGGTQRLAEIDGRLVGIGLSARHDALSAYTYDRAADVIVIGSPVPPEPVAATFAELDAALGRARRALGDDAPLLVHVDARASLETMRGLVWIAVLHGADGVLLSRFQRQADGWDVARTVDWNAVDALRSELDALRGALAGLDYRGAGAAQRSGPVVFRRARTRAGREVVVAVNLSGSGIPDAALARGGGAVVHERFGPWEGRVVELPDE